MKKTHIALLTTGALLLLALLLPAAAAAEPKLVKAENRDTQMVFYPLVEFVTMTLTVTGPCDFQYRKVVTDGELVFGLDETTIDGNYTWNVFRTEKISPDVIEQLQQARKQFDEETPRRLCREGRLPPPPQSQSGGFRVFEGRIIWDPDKQEDGRRQANAAPGDGLSGPALSGKGSDPFAKDFVINDDLIVDGSACIGFDCVNGESFGFDTIRVKENNLRIKFDDTSTAASFPRNDWQLTANDSANGGASKFSIDDISGSRTPFTVEANARSHALYVDDGGRIGSRTSTPSTEIHTIDGDTPTLRLQQDGSSGFAPQTWDVAGNETNFFIRDVTNGSQLPFRIRPDAPTSSIFIDVDGDVGMGTSSPGADLHVVDNGAVQLRLDNTDTGSGGVPWNLNSAADGTFRISDVDSGSSVLELQMDGDGNVEIAGELVTGGGGLCDPGPCDGTFGDYELESIEEHAAYMWQNKHLWGVGPTPEGAPINISKKTTGLLHELEKAHIYIEELNDRLKDKEAQVESLDERVKRLEALLAAAN
jgi:hypothetical protein